MPKRSVLIVQNISREEPGIISDVLDKNGITSTIVNMSQNQELPYPLDFDAVIVMGGPDSANDNTPKMHSELALVRECLDNNVPYLGICLGMQDLVHETGGKVVPNTFREVGFRHADGQSYKVILTEEGQKDQLFEGLGNEFPVFHLHGETVELTENITLLAKGNFVPNQIVKAGTNSYGIQSHFELTQKMLEKWLEEDPWLKETDTEKIRQQFDEIKEQYTQTAQQLFTNFLTIANLI